MVNILNLILAPFHFVIVALIGKLSWQAPKWLLFLIRDKFWSIGFILLAMACYGSYIYIESLPKPIMVKAEIRTPELPSRGSTTPSHLYIKFAYDVETLNSNQQKPSGRPSIASIELLKKEIKQGVNITPYVAGKWTWQNDNTIRFKPEQQWPPGVEYTVNFTPDIFTLGTKLASQQASFSTPTLKLGIQKLEFYQDPTDSKTRRVVSTITSTHPIDLDSLEKQISFDLSVNDKKANNAKKSINFSITHESNQRTVYLTTNSLEIPEKESYMTLTVNNGIKSPLGGKSSSTKSTDKVIIPDRYSLLKLDGFETDIIENEEGQPEQIIQLAFTDEIDEKELFKHLDFYILPKDKNGVKNYRWDRARDLDEKEITTELLIEKNRVKPELIPNPRSSSKNFNLKIDEDGGRYLYVKINSGIKSINDFILKDTSKGIFQAPRYPISLKFSGEGSILSYAGEHKLSIATRNVNTLKYSIGRLAGHQIHHLISQTYGDITKPDFQTSYFNKDNLLEYAEETVNLVPRHPKHINYSSFDLSRHLPNDKKRFGLFFVKVEGIDDYILERNRAYSEERLILVTDLGIIVKNNNDRSHDIFVQSTATGLPVANARVELLGKNGVPVLTGTTSARGHVNFSSTADFKNEKKPVAYVVTTASDTSFIPYDTHSRQINLSTFDIGGKSRYDYENRYDQNLNVYSFSDRGIYRPGESVNLAYIVKEDNLDNVEDIPLELIITGPRQNIVARKRLTLPELGFFDYNYQTSPTSDTGQYIASLHIVDNSGIGKNLGYTSFSVEEFQPDTMKINIQ